MTTAARPVTSPKARTFLLLCARRVRDAGQFLRTVGGFLGEEWEVLPQTAPQTSSCRQKNEQELPIAPGRWATSDLRCWPVFPRFPCHFVRACLTYFPSPPTSAPWPIPYFPGLSFPRLVFSSLLSPSSFFFSSFPKSINISNFISQLFNFSNPSSFKPSKWSRLVSSHSSLSFAPSPRLPSANPMALPSHCLLPKPWQVGKRKGEAACLYICQTATPNPTSGPPCGPCQICARYDQFPLKRAPFPCPAAQVSKF